MRIAIFTTLIFFAFGLAGCMEEGGDAVPAKQVVQASLITPGVWIVNGDPDHMLVWVHNPRKEDVTVEWRIEEANGTLPDGWKITTDKPKSMLKANGTKTGRGASTTYPDWAWTLMTLDLPSGVAAGDYALQLKTGEGTLSFTARVLANMTRTSKAGDTIEVKYDGKFQATGERFDAGSFETELGIGQTVPGFDFGLMGLAKNEKASLILPPALAYGYDQTSPSHAKFNGKALRFDVEIIRFA